MRCCGPPAEPRRTAVRPRFSSGATHCESGEACPPPSSRSSAPVRRRYCRSPGPRPSMNDRGRQYSPRWSAAPPPCWMSYSGPTEILPEVRTTWLPEWLPRMFEMFELIDYREKLFIFLRDPGSVGSAYILLMVSLASAWMLVGDRLHY
jgi:hypothetical protein